MEDANCYRHADFVKDPVIESVEFDVFHDIPLSANMSREQLLAEIDVDANLDIAGSFSDEDLLNEAKRRRRNNPEFSEDEEESGDEEPEINLILALKVIRKYAQKSEK